MKAESPVATNTEERKAQEQLTPWEKALNERFGEGFTEMARKDKNCPKCGTDSIMIDCPHCNNSIFYCSDCEETR